MVYAKDGNQGYLTNKGIESMRSAFGNDIFRNEQYKLFEIETEIRNELKETAKKKLYFYHQATPETDILFQQLLNQLSEYKGKTKYGYLPKAIKNTVDEIVKVIAQDDEIAELYNKWNKVNRRKLLLYYEKKDPDIPLEQNKEFRSIKNMIIQYAVDIQNNQNYSIEQSAVIPVNSLFQSIAELISNSTQKKKQTLRSQLTKKQLQKLIEKKQAQGQKIDMTQINNDQEQYEDEDQGFGLFM